MTEQRYSELCRQFRSGGGRSQDIRELLTYTEELRSQLKLKAPQWDSGRGGVRNGVKPAPPKAKPTPPKKTITDPSAEKTADPTEEKSDVEGQQPRTERQHAQAETAVDSGQSEEQPEREHPAAIDSEDRSQPVGSGSESVDPDEIPFGAE